MASESAKMRRFVLLATLLLAGCSWFASPPPKRYARPAVTEEQISSDIEACKQQARAVQQRDFEITHDIGGQVQLEEAETYFDTRLTENVDAYATRASYNDMISECMAARGYGDPDD